MLIAAMPHSSNKRNVAEIDIEQFHLETRLSTEKTIVLEDVEKKNIQLIPVHDISAISRAIRNIKLKIFNQLKKWSSSIVR